MLMLSEDAVTLRRQAYSAVRWTALAAVATALLQVLQIAILTRFLTPADFGLMALASAAIALATVFADMGVSSAVIHHQDVSSEQRSSLYWLNVCAAALLGLLLLAIGPLLADFYEDRRLATLIAMAAAVILLNALAQQLRVEAAKHLRFAGLVRIEIAALAAGFAVAVGSAIAGLGVYALAAGAVSAALTSTVLTWAFLSGGWRPLFRLRLSEIRAFTRFGFFIMGSNLAGTVNLMADVLIGGRRLGVDALGIYSLPRNLCLQVQFLVNPIVTRVGFPVMAKVQNDSAGLKTVYLRTLAMTASVNFPIYLGLAVFAPEIAGLLFGEKWAGSVELLRLLAVWGMLRSAGNPVGSLLLAVGRADLSFRWNLVFLFIGPPTIWVGCGLGASGLAVTLVFLQLVAFVPGWYFLVRPHCGARFSEYLGPMVSPLWIGLVSIGAAFAAAATVDGMLSRLAIAGAVALPIYLGISHAFNREWTTSMLELLGIIRPAAR